MSPPARGRFKELTGLRPQYGTADRDGCGDVAEAHLRQRARCCDDALAAVSPTVAVFRGLPRQAVPLRKNVGRNEHGVEGDSSSDNKMRRWRLGGPSDNDGERCPGVGQAAQGLTLAPWPSETVGVVPCGMSVSAKRCVGAACRMRGWTPSLPGAHAEVLRRQRLLVGHRSKPTYCHRRSGLVSNGFAYGAASAGGARRHCRPHAPSPRKYTWASGPPHAVPRPEAQGVWSSDANA